ncbi:MAG: protoporphyrinogen oxidase [Actinomycetota bacterium]
MPLRAPGRVVVVGGGVAGLTAAYRLGSGPDAADVTVVEAEGGVGGKLTSVHVGDLELEAGADSFVARKPWAVDLCRELGLGGELVAPGTSGAYLWTTRGLVPYLKDTAFGIPGDVGDVFRWPGLSRAGRARALQDLVRTTRKDPSDESLGAMLRRRLGDEATDRSVAPLLGGLFAGDVDRLSVQATFPELVAWERSQGSLIRGAQAARRAAGGAAAPGPMFLKLRGGTARLTDALADAVGPEHVLTADRTLRVEPRGRTIVAHGRLGALEADAVVLATPATASARLLEPVAPPTAAELGAIPYASTAVVFLVYPEGTADALPEGTGFVVPRGWAPMTAATWLSNKWPDPAFGTRAVIRCYLGGVGYQDVVDEPDEDLVGACVHHLAALLPLPERAMAAEVVRWRRAMPQYEVGHLDRVTRIRACLPSGIFVTGSAYGGVGIPDTVRDANDTATQVRTYLQASTRQETLR